MAEMTAQQLARQRLAHTDLTAFMPTTKEDKRRRESCEASKRYRATTKGKSTNAKKCREYQRNHPEIVAKAVKKYQDKYAREHGGITLNAWGYWRRRLNSGEITPSDVPAKYKQCLEDWELKNGKN